MKASLPCTHALDARVQLPAVAAASEHCSSHAVALLPAAVYLPVLPPGTQCKQTMILYKVSKLKPHVKHFSDRSDSFNRFWNLFVRIIHFLLVSDSLLFVILNLPSSLTKTHFGSAPLQNYIPAYVVKVGLSY